jgi:hypothetical protein
MVFEWQGEGSREVNGPPDVCPRPFARNQDRVRATTWEALNLPNLSIESTPGHLLDEFPQVIAGL